MTLGSSNRSHLRRSRLDDCHDARFLSADPRLVNTEDSCLRPESLSTHVLLDAFVVRPCHHRERDVRVTAKHKGVETAYPALVSEPRSVLGMPWTNAPSPNRRTLILGDPLLSAMLYYVRTHLGRAKVLSGYTGRRRLSGGGQRPTLSDRVTPPKQWSRTSVDDISYLTRA